MPNIDPHLLTERRRLYRGVTHWSIPRPVLSSLLLLILVIFIQNTTSEHAPQIITPPRSQVVVNGRVASFFCVANGDPRPMIEWRRNGKRLVTQRYTALDVPPSASVLRIEPVKAGRDNATYECLVENGIGEPERAQAVLSVITEDEIPVGFPRFEHQPHMQGVERGRSALIPCKASGSPEPVITWLKDMIPLDLNNPRYSVYHGGSLQIVNATDSDQGQYECLAENSVGSAFSDLAALYVRSRQVPPYFSIPPEPTYEVMPGTSLNITCVAVGSPMPYVFWRRAHSTEPITTTTQPVGKNVLELRDIRDSANFTCIAHSKLGTKEATTAILVQSQPRPPVNVRVTEVSQTSIRLSWSYEYGSDQILYYVIQYKEKSSSQTDHYTELSGITAQHHSIPSLMPFTEYEFFVLAVNAIGRGPRSMPVYASTGDNKPGGMPRNVQARALSSSTIVITWEAPEEANSQVLGYKVYYTTDPHSPVNTWRVQTVDNSHLTTANELVHDVIYTIRVQALTTRGEGPLSAPIQVKTTQGAPSQPANLRIVAVTAATVQLSWTKPPHSSEAITGYEVYWNDTFSQQEYHRSIPAIESYTLTDLYPDTVYYVWVSAKSKRSEGAATTPMPVKTEQYIPSAPPLNVRAEAEDSRTLAVRWDPPSANLRPGMITHYKVSYTPISDTLSTKELKPREVNVTTQDPDHAHRELPLFARLKDLAKWTQYRIVVRSHNSRGDGQNSSPFYIRTQEDVPGEPQHVRTAAINSTTVLVEWKAPSNKEQNGQIRGYQIHVQEQNREGDLMNDPLRYDVADGMAESFNITGLQPDTEYQIQVAAVTRKGDGTRSRTKNVRTMGGVPTRPEVYVRALEDDPLMSIELHWSRPNFTYGSLLKYRVRYGRDGEPDRREFEFDPTDTHKVIRELDRGVKYEIRMAGKNAIGWGQEAVAYVETPEGRPSAPPQNITFRLQSPTTVVIQWEPPASQHRNGRVNGYIFHFHKSTDSRSDERNTTMTRIVGSGLDENTEYTFKVAAYTAKGLGPWSQRLHITTPSDVPPAPTNVQAMATSERSVEVWWEFVPLFGQIVGYQVLFSQQPAEDLDLWESKRVAITSSAELNGLEVDTMYAIRVAAHSADGSLGKLSELITVRTTPTDVPVSLRAHSVSTHSMTLTWRPPPKLDPIKYRVSYAAQKEFYDSQDTLQQLSIPITEVYLSGDVTEFRVEGLMPFTSYQVNVSCIPMDDTWRPAAKITVTTGMAAPKPMVKPDSLGVQSGQQIKVILPHASEEYGPISHYLLCVVPDEMALKDPDNYQISELTETPTDTTGPYIAAKFYRRSMQSKFDLGDGKMHGGYLNRVLLRNQKYRIFVRAVVDTPTSSLFTSSPFSEPLSLETASAHQASAGGEDTPDRRPTSPHQIQVGTVWLVGALLGVILIVIVFVTAVLLKRRRQELKAYHQNGETTMKLLMNNTATRDYDHTNGRLAGGDYGGTLLAGGGVQAHQGAVGGMGPQMGQMMVGAGAGGPAPPHMIAAHMAAAAAAAQLPPHPHPMDPVELRRTNNQTAALASHPPIPVVDLAAYIDHLKMDENYKFSQEYESIDPGQQFTWENSNLDINKPKNRYANVVAYDHSRLVLSPLDGSPGSDYINANYCDGYRKPNAYVATQGPLPDTIGDFWRMCWEQRSMTIVMMTKLEERGRVKCDQYWPTRGTDVYGVMQVTLLQLEELATYTIRTFALQRAGYAETREIRQLQFTAWPDHGVPDHPTPFLMFLRRVKSMNPPDAGPLLIHCSAGVGRTGCFVVIDSMLERLQYENTVDIYGHVTCLRAQRNYTVQTEDQYIFIYDSVLEAVVTGITEVSTINLFAHMQMLMQSTVPGEDGVPTTGLELEFKKIAAMVTSPPPKFHSATLPCNKAKNRLMNILPYENTRVCLQPLHGVDGSDYINGSYIDGYRYRKAYVATQGPLAETEEDFWRMIIEHNSNIIVTLTKTREMGREKCHQYWPSERSCRYLYYIVEPITEYNMPTYVLREFKVTDARDAQTRTIRQFHFIDWPEQGVPKSGDGLIEFITAVHKTKEQFGHSGPITVHCSAGVGRTGVFITLSIALERLQNEGMVDLFSIIRTLRTQRPGMVQSEEEYQFLYRSLLEYVNSYDQ